MLEIGLFGEPSFTVDGRPHAFVAPPKALPLLAYLLLHRNAPVARESVAGVMWPEVDEETARANLRRHLHYIRKALPAGEWLRVDGKTVQWNPDAPYRLDAAEFEQQSKLPQMRRLAVKLYRGDLYSACEEEWLYFERERLRNMQIGNLAALAQDAERALDHVTAAAHARELLEIEPWREDALRVLMRARMQIGDRGGALSEYERFRERLIDEMGVEPMPETRQLFEAFARMDDRAPASGGRSQALIGRSGELESLLVQWRSAANGRGAFALIGGEAGVGKSALLQALATEVRESGGVVLTGELAREGDTPYAAFTRALGQAQLQGKLRTAVSSTAAGLAETGERGAFFASIAAALQSISEHSPVLLCIEDLHWAGGDTIALVEFLERRLRDARVLVACSYREDAIAADHRLRGLRRILSARTAYVHVALNALTPADTERVVRRRLGQSVDDRVVQTLYRRSQGNAFFLTELLENVAAGQESDVPDSIRDLVDERWEQLGAGARDIIESLAVAGATVSPDLLSALYESAENPPTRALDELVQARFLRDEPGPGGTSYAFIHDVVRESLYDRIPAQRRTMLHARVAAAMERVSSTRYAAAIALHYERGGNDNAAAHAYVRAAAQAMSGFANDDAEHFARKALELNDDVTAAMQAYAYLDVVYHRAGKRDLQLRNGEQMESAAQRSGNPLYVCEAIYRRLAQAFHENDAEQMAVQLERLRAHVPPDPLWNARLEAFTGSYAALCGDPERAWTHLHNALLSFRDTGQGFEELSCYERLLEICDGYTRSYAALLEEARALERRLGDPDSTFLLANAEAKLFLHVDRTQCRHSALRIVEAGERTGDQVYIGVGHMYLGAVATYRFEPEAAEEHFRRAFAALQDSARHADIARLFRFRGLFYYNAGDVERGLEDSLAALESARRARAYDLIAVSAGNAIYGFGLLGHFEEAERLAARVWNDLRSVRQHYLGVHHMMLSLAIVLAAQGRFDEAIRLMQRSYEEHENRGQKLHAAWTGTSLAYEMLRAGRAPEARRYIENYLRMLPDMLDEGWMPQLTLWQAAQVLRALQERDRAQQLLVRSAQVVASRLAALPREEQQRRFMEFPANREILRAHSENVWPTF